MILFPIQAWSYVDEDLVEKNGNTWTVAPANDAYRDADTVQYVLDSAAEGDTIRLLGGTFDFTMTKLIPGAPERIIEVNQSSLLIRGQTEDDEGTISYLTFIVGSSSPFGTPSGAVVIAAVVIDGVVIDDIPVDQLKPDRGEILNISTRGVLSQGENMIGGFVVGGTTGDMQTVLIRAVGPTLSDFDVDLPCSNPQLTVFQGGTQIDANDDWCCTDKNKASCLAACERSGAFPLRVGAKDASIVLRLAPGAYTVMCNGAGGSYGEVLVEVYLAPVE